MSWEELLASFALITAKWFYDAEIPRAAKKPTADHKSFLKISVYN